MSHDALTPSAPLVPGPNGDFYGVGELGGSANHGALFQITPSGQVTIFHSFGDGSITSDGAYPLDLVAAADGNFYGATSGGGSNNGGTVFKFTPPATGHPLGVLTIVHVFGTITPDGFGPNGVIYGTDGNLYGTTSTGGNSGNGGTVFSIVPGTGATKIIHEFGNQGGEGTHPSAKVTLGSDGLLYGTTTDGGTGYTGTVYRMTTTGGSYQILHTFDDGSVTNDGASPGPLLLAADGSLYGTTVQGGLQGAGTFFKITPSGTETVLYSFGTTNGLYAGEYPGNGGNTGISAQTLMLAADGNFYGWTFDALPAPQSGTIYKITPQGVITFLHHFQDGTVPGDGAAALFLAQGTDGNLYGTTAFNGDTFYKITLAAPGLTSPPTASGAVGVPFSYQVTGTHAPTAFAASGLPAGLTINATTGLISGAPTAVPSSVPVTLTLTNASGSAPFATTFTIAARPAPVITSSAAAFGVVNTAFSYQITANGSPTSYSATSLPAGLSVNTSTGLVTGTVASATSSNATVTATNATGSTNKIVTFNFFATTPTLGQRYGILHSFLDGTVANDGYQPTGPLVQGFDGSLEGSLYKNDVFNLSLTGTETIAHTFVYPPTSTSASVFADGSNGLGVIQATDGNFYGMTSSGGIADQGTIYRLTPWGSIAILHSFGDGTVPNDGAATNNYGFSLVEGTDGNLYGTTRAGGTINDGIIFRITPQGVYTILHNFGTGSNDGTNPVCSMIQGSDGNFYGTTTLGGSNGQGTIFELTPSGAYSIIHAFGAVGDGSQPIGDLIQAADGTFYGTTSGGGSEGEGTVYHLTLPATVTILHSFDDGSVTNDGEDPQSGLIQGFDGNFYGTTLAGGSPEYGYGAVYRMTPAGVVTILHAFAGNSDGTDNYDALLEAADGNFYGITQGGGPANNGTAYTIVGNQVPTLAPVAAGPTAATLALNNPGTFRLLLKPGAGATTWTETGTLPPGMTFSSATGMVSGRPTTTGAWPLSLKATNAIGSVTKTVTLTVVTTALTSATAVTANTVGAAFSYQIAGTGNPYAFGASNLPSWLSFNAATGVISGTTPSEGVWTIYPTATNIAGVAEQAVVITVEKLNQTITFPAIANQLTTGGPVTLSATTTSSLPLTYTLVSGPATIAGNTVTLTGQPGEVTISAAQAGNNTYHAATSVSQSFLVQKTQTITLGTIANRPYRTTPLTVSASASSGLAVTLGVSGPATLSGTSLTMTGAGLVTVMANQAGNTTYAAAPQVSTSFTVTQATQTITFPAMGSQPYGSVLTLAATASSGLAVSYSVISGPATVSGTSVTFTGVGAVKLQASQAGNADYSAATSVTQTFSVVKASQSITFPTIPGQLVLGHYALNATASSGLAVTYTVSGPATINGSNVLTFTGGGTVAVTAHQAGNTDYGIAPNVQNVFAVARKGQDIGFPAIPTQTYLGPTYTLNAYATSGLAVTYTVSGDATLSGNVLTITGAGGVQVVAGQSGNSIYGAAANIIRNFRVSKATQTITFPSIPNQPLSEGTLTLGATASSGLAVTYTVTGPATVSGNVLTFTGAGTVSVAAHQAGNTNFNVAPNVQNQFTVIP